MVFNKKSRNKKVPRIPLRGVLKYRKMDHAHTLLNLHKTYGPFIRFPFGGRLLVADPKVVQHVLLTNMDNYSKDLSDYRLLTFLMGSGLLTSEGKRWRAQRQVMQPLFHLRNMPQYFDLTQQALDRFCVYWGALAASGEPVDITLEMMTLSMMMTAECLLNVSFEAVEAKRLVEHFFYQHAHVCKTGNIFSWLPLPANIRYQLAKRVTTKAAEKVYRTPSVDGTENAVTVMRDNGFSEEDILDQVRTVLATGHETTGLGLAWAWYLLDKNPGAQKALQTEITSGLEAKFDYASLEKFSYTQNVFQEAVRLYPPIWAIPRYAKKDDTVAGYKVKAGTKLLINIFSLQRLPTQWQSPEAFRPERFSKAQREKRHKYAYLPFGAGPHVCIANGLALMQAKMAMVQLASQFSITLADPDLTPKVKTYVTLKSDKAIMMRIQKREK